jgi:hypothetical protein
MVGIGLRGLAEQLSKSGGDSERAPGPAEPIVERRWRPCSLMRPGEMKEETMSVRTTSLVQSLFAGSNDVVGDIH